MTNQVHLSFAAPTSAELMEQVKAFAANTGGDPLETISTDALLAALRERMAKQTPLMVVSVEPFEKPAGEAPTRTRKPKPDATKTAEATATEQKTEPVREEPKEVVEGTQEPATGDDAGDWDGGAEEPAKATKDDVLKALNECSGKHGQAKTRAVMQNFGGARLADVKEDRFGELVAALKAKTAEPAEQNQAAA